jgi:3-dehydroquinate dehydratase I
VKTAIGTCMLGNRPRIALAIGDDVVLQDVNACLSLGIDMIEVRIDQFQRSEAQHVCEYLEQFAAVPSIGTIRSRSEGGNWTQSEDARRILYASILPYVKAIDIEIGADEINEDLIGMAKKAGVTVIGSFHNFSCTPDQDCLKEILRKGKTLKVDIVKMATHCKNKADLKTLAKFLLTHEKEALILIGMGVAGAPSRILFPFLGSLITYTFLGKPTAPGQFNCEDTVAFIKRTSGESDP